MVETTEDDLARELEELKANEVREKAAGADGDGNGGGEIAHKLLTRQKCDFTFGTAATGDTIYSGEGYVSSCEISGTMEEAVTYSGTITVTGAITESTN